MKRQFYRSTRIMIIKCTKAWNRAFWVILKSTQKIPHIFSIRKGMLQSSLAITLSLGGIFWYRVISEARYRFCRQVFFFFFLILYIFFDCKLLYLLCTLPRCTFTTHYVYCIFIPICFIDLSSVIKIDVPNKWASACAQPAIADCWWQYWLNKQPH